jgi:hypothetical protein
LRWLDLAPGTSTDAVERPKDVEYEIDPISRIWRIRKKWKMPGWCKKSEKHGRMSGAGGGRGDEGSGKAEYSTSQFLVNNQKHYIKKISRTERAMVGRNQ